MLLIFASELFYQVLNFEYKELQKNEIKCLTVKYNCQLDIGVDLLFYVCLL